MLSENAEPPYHVEKILVPPKIFVLHSVMRH